MRTLKLGMKGKGGIWENLTMWIAKHNDIFNG